MRTPLSERFGIGYAAVVMILTGLTIYEQAAALLVATGAVIVMGLAVCDYLTWKEAKSERPQRSEAKATNAEPRQPRDRP